MPNEPRTPQARPVKWRRAVAVLAVASLTVAACGSNNQETAAESSVITEVPAGRGDVEYGASLEEWAEGTDPGTDAGTEVATEPGSEDQVVNDYPEGFEQVDWEDLLPPGYSSDDVFARYKDRLNALEDGSPEAEAIYTEMQAEYEANSDAINNELAGAKVNLAGFVAPLSYEDDIVTEFLLVPYFGACVHVPAPPPNQTVLVRVDASSGLSLEEVWGAVWVAGTLTVDPATTDLATASYTMTDATSGVYDEYG